MYELLLTIHLLAAATWVGGSIALTVLASRMKGADRMVTVPHFSWYGGRVITGAAIVLMLAGIGLVNELEYVEIGDLWVIVGIVGWVASAVIGGAVLGPIGQKLQEGPAPHEAEELYSRLLAVSRFDALIVALVVVDMAVKPGA